MRRERDAARTTGAVDRASRPAPLGLVDIVREFLDVGEQMKALFVRYRRGELDFDSVRRLCDDNDGSALFRLKERCHSLFRRDDGRGVTGAPGREALFDLAVGSLFHEAMKLRENLYQLERYRPRVEALRQQGDRDSGELFDEFEKILERSSTSLEESVLEVERLTGQIRAQLMRLIVDHGATGLVARCLYENREALDCVYPEGLDALLGGVFGDAVEGYLAAAESYLESAYYSDALAALAEAGRRAPSHEDVHRAALYAEGMQAFFSRDYARSMARLADWLDAGPPPAQPERIALAFAGTNHVERLPEDDESADVIAQAAALSKRLRALQPA